MKKADPGLVVKDNFLRFYLFLFFGLLLLGCATRSASMRPQTHIIKKGDTLYGISRQYNVSISAIQRINHIQDPQALRIGTRLKIPNDADVDADAEPEANGQADINTAAVNPILPKTAPPVQTQATPKSENHRFIWPLKKVDISSGFGRRSLFDNHQGMDLRAPRGTSIFAAADGVVIYAGRPNLWGGYGNMVKIRHSGRFATIYAHNNRNIVQAGQKVSQGQIIATVGSSGNATGNHLHFEIRFKGRPQNPEKYLRK